MMPWQRLRRKLFGRHKKSYFEGSKLFIPEVLTWDDIYLEGYWQTEKYFQPVEGQVRDVYDTDRLTAYLKRSGCWGAGGERRTRKMAQDYLDEINNTCSVSLHVRRGDYLTPENQKLYGGICTDAYYIEGIRQMRERFPGCRFFLFTNDRAWAVQQSAEAVCQETEAEKPGGNGKTSGYAECLFSAADITWIDLPGGDNDYAEFVLMSRCKHHILANSSFSWWASYLNKNPEKTVLAPQRWLNGTDDSDFYRADMCKIGPLQES